MQIRIANWIFIALLCVYGVYAGMFMYRTSFMVGEERYYVLFDDAMISMRYGQNLAGGYGPVWNPGERVEGFTNPLWVGYMALVHLFPLPASKTSLAIQITSAILLMLNLVFVRRIARDLSNSDLTALLAAFLTAFYFSLNNWALQGMEVGLVALLLTIVLWMASQQFKTDTFSVWPYVILGIGTWVRMDMLAPGLVILGYLAFLSPAHRRKHLLWGGGLLIGMMAVQTLLRYSYYGEVLPNTYYLKIEGYSLWQRVKLGLKVYGQFIWLMNWVLYLLPFMAVALKPTRTSILLLLIFLVQSAYSIYVGGDAWEHRGGANRFISVAMPGFIILLTVGIDEIRKLFIASIEPYWQRIKFRVLPLFSQGVMIVFVVTSLFSLNTIITNDAVAKWMALKRPIFTKGSEKNLLIGLALRDLTTEDAWIAVIAAGTAPYFSERNAIDLLGKADKVISHKTPRSLSGITEDEEFRPGHNKWDYAYSIGELKPDIIVQLWSNPEEAQPFLEADYIPVVIEDQTMYFRKDSPNILWDLVPIEDD
jgi:arabinofuranosyltransferase